MVALLIMLVGVPLVLRWYGRRVERSDGKAEDKVHRLRRALVIAMLLPGVLAGVAVIELRAELGIPREGGQAMVVGVLVGFLVVVVVGLTLNYLAVHPTTSRLRGLPAQSRTAAGRHARLMLVLLLPTLLWLVILIVTRQLFELRSWMFFVLAGAFVLLMLAAGPLVVRLAMPTTRVPDSERERLERLCRRQGVKIRDFRVIDSGPEKVANAAVAGISRMRYVFVSDRLLELFSPEELDAVVAHELGHAKQHHLAIKVGAHLAIVFALILLWWGIVEVLDIEGAAAGALSLGFLLLVLLAILVVQGAVGIRLERRADDYAAEATSPDALRDGLSKLAEINMMKRRTGKVWNLLQQHPGLEQRIERLERAAAHV